MVESDASTESLPDEATARFLQQRLSDRERWLKMRAAQERWKAANRERYLEQKRLLARRPDYLASRRALYWQRKNVAAMTLSKGSCDNDD